MINESTPPHTPAKSDEMRTADTANGENPDVDVVDTEKQAPHRTGEQQARENAENDPPA